MERKVEKGEGVRKTAVEEEARARIEKKEGQENEKGLTKKRGKCSMINKNCGGGAGGEVAP